MANAKAIGNARRRNKTAMMDLLTGELRHGLAMPGDAFETQESCGGAREPTAGPARTGGNSSKIREDKAAAMTLGGGTLIPAEIWISKSQQPGKGARLKVRASGLTWNLVAICVELERLGPVGRTNDDLVHALRGRIEIRHIADGNKGAGDKREKHQMGDPPAQYFRSGDIPPDAHAAPVGDVRKRLTLA